MCEGYCPIMRHTNKDEILLNIYHVIKPNWTTQYLVEFTMKFQKFQILFITILI